MVFLVQMVRMVHFAIQKKRKILVVSEKNWLFVKKILAVSEKILIVSGKISVVSEKL